MTRKFTTQIEYEAFFARVEQAFEPENMTQSELAEWLNNDSLADQFSLTRAIYLMAKETNNLAKLKELRNDSSKLIIHKEKVIDLIEDKIQQIEIGREERRLAETIARQVEAEFIEISTGEVRQTKAVRTFVTVKGKKQLRLRDKKGRFVKAR